MGRLRALAMNKLFVYGLERGMHRVNRSDRVIRNFADRETERLFATEQSRRLPPDIQFRALAQLNRLHAATSIEDLRSPPSNRLEPLRGDRMGQWSIRINQQWRVCFRFVEGDALDVEIVDYH
jgi:proteic killer suppression protein